jgi:arabinoxylan arabinofuranohydrolase
MSARNPVLPPETWIPDVEARVMPDGKLYLYGSWDRYEDVMCCRQYRVVSTADLAEWTMHEISFEVDESLWEWHEPPAKLVRTLSRGRRLGPILRTGKQLRQSGVLKAFQRGAKAGRAYPGPILFAPDCIEKDGRYHLFFDLSDGREGVATSDNAVGPFSDPVQLPATGIDPAAFTDDDGQTYYYWGQFSVSGVRLDEDLRGFDTDAVTHGLVTEKEHGFHEGASVRRIGDTYYLVFTDSSRGKPTSLGYATGPSPLGPFTYRGIIIDNDNCDPLSWNNHGSIEQFNGNWYVFYHRASGNSATRRRVCVEPISIAPDGSIAEVPMTSQGTGEPFAPGEVIDGWRACAVSGGAYVGAASDAGERLLLPGAGATGTYRYAASSDGFTRVEVMGEGTGLLELRLGSQRVTDVQVGRGTGTAAFDRLPAGIEEVSLVSRTDSALAVRSLTLW